MSRIPAPSGNQSEPGTFEICLRGHLDSRWAARLGVPSLIHASDGTTILRGIVEDQAVVHGLLQRVRDLGLPLISVLHIDPDQSK